MKWKSDQNVQLFVHICNNGNILIIIVRVLKGLFTANDPKRIAHAFSQFDHMQDWRASHCIDKHWLQLMNNVFYIYINIIIIIIMIVQNQEAGRKKNMVEGSRPKNKKWTKQTLNETLLFIIGTYTSDLTGEMKCKKQRQMSALTLFQQVHAFHLSTVTITVVKNKRAEIQGRKEETLHGNYDELWMSNEQWIRFFFFILIFFSAPFPLFSFNIP